MQKVIVIFRRDIRLQDNAALRAAVKEGAIIPCFIFDPNQVTERNKFLTLNGLQFMIESLQELAQSIEQLGGTLYCLYGPSQEVVPALIAQSGATHLYVNTDYTLFSKIRDAALQIICDDLGVIFRTFEDLLLCDPRMLLTGKGSPYTVFTPFYKYASQLIVAKPQQLGEMQFFKPSFRELHMVDIALEGSSRGKILSASNTLCAQRGGRSPALEKLRAIKNFYNYAHERDIPAIDTTRLSAALKFGTVSIRECFHAIENTLGKDSILIKQLFWRDFYTYIGYHFPHVFTGAFKQKYDSMPWSYNAVRFERWASGMTGFPIVDAGMRELNTTGYMHNRVRMITASFLTKDLHINWQLGERYFARTLVDYDPAVNNGNWQWVASTGCDPQPYFRIFNPWLQQKKFDPQCEYIKKWIPELAGIDPRLIHKHMNSQKSLNGYPAPMLDHAVEVRKSWIIYKKIIA